MPILAATLIRPRV